MPTFHQASLLDANAAEIRYPKTLTRPPFYQHVYATRITNILNHNKNALHRYRPYLKAHTFPVPSSLPSNLISNQPNPSPLNHTHPLPIPRTTPFPSPLANNVTTPSIHMRLIHHHNSIATPPSTCIFLNPLPYTLLALYCFLFFAPSPSFLSYGDLLSISEVHGESML